MDTISQILDSVRQNIAESVDLRTVIIGEQDVPATLLPAAKIMTTAVISNSLASPALVFDLTLTVEMIFPPSEKGENVKKCVYDAIKVLASDIYPDGCRIVEPPRAKISPPPSKTAMVSITLRWIES